MVLGGGQAGMEMALMGQERQREGSSQELGEMGLEGSQGAGLSQFKDDPSFLNAGHLLHVDALIPVYAQVLAPLFLAKAAQLGYSLPPQRAKGPSNCTEGIAVLQASRVWASC